MLTAVGQALWQHDRLPVRVATHFGAAGQPNGWMSRGAHTVWHVTTVLFLAAIIQGITLVHSRLPAKFINLPHRELWLAPERAVATREWISGTVQLVGCALMLFFIALFHLVYRANLSPQPRLSTAIWWYLGGLLAIVFGVLARLLVKFGRKPAA